MFYFRQNEEKIYLEKLYPKFVVTGSLKFLHNITVSPKRLDVISYIKNRTAI